MSTIYNVTRTSSEKNLVNGVTFSANNAIIPAGYGIGINIGFRVKVDIWDSYSYRYKFSVTMNTTAGNDTKDAYAQYGNEQFKFAGCNPLSPVSFSQSNATVTSIVIRCTDKPSNSTYIEVTDAYLVTYNNLPQYPDYQYMEPPSYIVASCNGIAGQELYVQPGAQVLFGFGGAPSKSFSRTEYGTSYNPDTGQYEPTTYTVYYTVSPSSYGIEVYDYFNGNFYDRSHRVDYTYSSTNPILLTMPSTVGAVRYLTAYVSETSPSGYTSSATTPPITIHIINTTPSAPTGVRVDNSILSPGDTTTLRWNSVTGIANNVITGYTIYKNGVGVGTTTTTAYTVTAPQLAGTSDVYTVAANGSVSSSSQSSGVRVYAYTPPSAPSSVSVSQTDVPVNTDVTLSWSGASGGYQNPIKGYEVYRGTSYSGTYTKISGLLSTSTSTFTVTSSSTQGQTYYFKVRAVGTYGNSFADSDIVTLTSYIYQKVGAPKTISVSPNNVPANGSATLTWGAGEDRRYVTIVGYDVYRSTSYDGTYNKIGSTIIGNSTTVYAGSTTGYYYKIRAIASISGYDSDLSEAYTHLSLNLAPTIPTGFTVSPTEYNSGNLVFEWHASTDPEGDTVRYKLEMTYNDSTSTVATNLENTLYSVDLTGTIAQGTNATFRVYAYDARSTSEASQAVIVHRVDTPSNNDIELVNYTGNMCYSQYVRLLFKAKREVLVSAPGWYISNDEFIQAGDYFIITSINKYEPSEVGEDGYINVTVNLVIRDAYNNIGEAVYHVTVALPEYVDEPAETDTFVKASQMNNLRNLVSSHYKFMTSTEYPAWSSGLITAGETSLSLWLTHLNEVRRCVEATVDYVNNKLGKVVLPAPQWLAIDTNKPNAYAMNQVWLFIRDSL